jgi:hypothetical protein
MRALLAMLLLCVLPRLSAGQERPGADRRGAARGPSMWLSASAGFALLNDVADGSTGSNWDFGNAWPLRVTVERALGGGTTIGAQMTYARAPLLYRGNGSCVTCNAHATVTSYGPILRVGQGRSWYQVLELFAGVLQYGSFTEDGASTRLPPLEANRDFAFSVGYGFGFPIARDFAIELTSTYLSAIHERRNLPGNAQTMVQHYSLTLGTRLGF